MTDATPAVCVAAQQDSTGITSSVQAGLMRASTPRLDELAQMSLEALVAPEVGIASWRANTWTWRPGPARRVGLGFGSARIAADCAHEIVGRLHGTDRVDRDPRPLWCFPSQRLHAGGRRVQNEIGAWSGAPRSVLTGDGSSPPRKTTRRGCAMPRRQHDPSPSTPVMNIGQGRAHPPISSDSLLEGDGFELLVPPRRNSPRTRYVVSEYGSTNTERH